MKGYYFNKLASTVYSGLNNIYSLSALGNKNDTILPFLFNSFEQSTLLLHSYG